MQHPSFNSTIYITPLFPQYQEETQEAPDVILKKIFSVDVSITDILTNDKETIENNDLNAVFQAFEEVLHRGEVEFEFDKNHYQLGPQQFEESGEIFYPLKNAIGQEILKLDATHLGKLKAKINSMTLLNLLTVDIQQSFGELLAERQSLEAADVSKNLQQVLSRVLNAVRNGRVDLNKMGELAGIFNTAESIEGLENSPQLHQFSQALNDRMGNQGGRPLRLRQQRRLVFFVQRNEALRGREEFNFDMPSAKRPRFY